MSNETQVTLRWRNKEIVSGTLLIFSRDCWIERKMELKSIDFVRDPAAEGKSIENDWNQFLDFGGDASHKWIESVNKICIR